MPTLPRRVLERVIALRVHLDDSTANNGPLRVLPGTHVLGVLDDTQIHELSQRVQPAQCAVPAGGVIAMRPLLVHASSKASGGNAAARIASRVRGITRARSQASSFAPPDLRAARCVPFC